jgi:hypothetical protein
MEVNMISIGLEIFVWMQWYDFRLKLCEDQVGGNWLTLRFGHWTTEIESPWKKFNFMLEPNLYNKIYFVVVPHESFTYNVWIINQILEMDIQLSLTKSDWAFITTTHKLTFESYYFTLIGSGFIVSKVYLYRWPMVRNYLMFSFLLRLRKLTILQNLIRIRLLEWLLIFGMNTCSSN